MQYDKEFLDNLNRLIVSLKLAQRAELVNEENNKNIIDKLYVDPLPNEAIFKQVIEDSTIFLIGRKGTGKSTIFARAQEYFRHQSKEISAYIDVKTLYGKSISQDIKVDSDNEHVQKLILLQNFVSQVLGELINELEKSLEHKNLLGRILKKNKYKEVPFCRYHRSHML
jgi:ATPase subunit of ABC transporter with duplicated ATPase domains